MNYRELTDRAVQYATNSYIMRSGEIRPAFKPDKVVAVTATAMPLLISAAETLPSETRVDDPPIRTGFLYFEEKWPRLERGAEWQALFYSYAALNDDGTPIVFGLFGVPYLVRNEDGSLTPPGISADLPEDDLRYRAVAAFNLLLTQGVVEHEIWEATRQLQRQARRKGGVLDPVTIVRLPKRHYVTDGDGHTLTEWSHRWMVTGHWRKQWYAKAEVHRPKWIAPYVKGPDDKPLLVKEKRYVFDPYP